MWQLVLVSIGLGAGLAMDACAVSISNGLSEPDMKRGKTLGMTALFGLAQGLMPMIGWLCVSLVVEQFRKFEAWIPYIALVLLMIVGGKMLFDALRKQDEEAEPKKITGLMLLVQALATSIDALSAGFGLEDIAGTVWWKALISAAIIAMVTFGLCTGAAFLGKKFGAGLGRKAKIIGGCILIAIGIEIFVTGVFF